MMQITLVNSAGEPFDISEAAVTMYIKRDGEEAEELPIDVGFNTITLNECAADCRCMRCIAMDDS